MLLTGIPVFHLKFAKPYCASGTLLEAGSALNTTVVINFRQSVDHFNGIGRAILLADSASDTTDLAIGANHLAVIAGGTAHPILTGERNKVNNVFRAGIGTQAASYALFIFHHSHTVFDLDRAKRTDAHARPIA
jgi:hypothetical protein